MDVGVYSNTVHAFLGSGSLSAGGSVEVLSSSTETLDAVAAALALGSRASTGTAVGASLCTETLSPDVQAYVEGNVSTPQSLYVNAADDPTIAVIAGGAAGNAAPAIGAALTNVNFDGTVKAFIAGVVSAGGNGPALFDPNGSGFGGNGVIVHADSTDNFLLAAGGAGHFLLRPGRPGLGCR